MEHSVHKVKGFEIVGPYRLRIEFADGLVRTGWPVAPWRAPRWWWRARWRT